MILKKFVVVEATASSFRVSRMGGNSVLDWAEIL